MSIIQLQITRLLQNIVPAEYIHIIPDDKDVFTKDVLTRAISELIEQEELPLLLMRIMMKD